MDGGSQQCVQYGDGCRERHGQGTTVKGPTRGDCIERISEYGRDFRKELGLHDLQELIFPELASLHKSLGLSLQHLDPNGNFSLGIEPYP